MSDESVRRAAASAALGRLSAKKPISTVADRDLQLARKRLVHCINSELLDFKHCSTSGLAGCVDILLKLCSNVLEKPGTDSFRQVKAANKKLNSGIAANPSAAQKVLSELGWTIEVVNFEKHYVFQGMPGSSSFRRLQMGVEELQAAQRLLTDKEQRGIASKDKRKQEDAARREAAMLHFQDDRESRRLLDERELARQLAATQQSSPSLPSDQLPDLELLDHEEYTDSKKDR